MTGRRAPSNRSTPDAPIQCEEAAAWQRLTHWVSDLDAWTVARALREHERLLADDHLDLQSRLDALDANSKVLAEWSRRRDTLPSSGLPRMDPSYAAKLALDVLDSALEDVPGRDLLATLSRCLNHDLVPPKALSDELARRMGLLLTGRAAGWEDAFGRAFPEGIKPASVRAERFTAPMVYRTARALLAKNPHRPIDKEFWEDGVAKACKMSASGAEGLVRLHVEKSGALPLGRFKKLLLHPTSEFEALAAAIELMETATQVFESALGAAVNTEPDF